LFNDLGTQELPEAVEQKIPARCATTVGYFGGDPADPPDPDASETPFVIDAGPERAGPTDEGGTDAAGSLGSSGSFLGAEISTPNEPT